MGRKALGVKNKKIVFVELGGSHAECLLSPMVAFKKEGWEITLLINHSLILSNKHLVAQVNTLIHLPEPEDNALERQFRAHTHRLITSKHRYFFLNSAHGKILSRWALKHTFSSIVFFSQIHYAQKMRGSWHQFWINRKTLQFLVLGQFMLDQLPKAWRVKSMRFYNIRFPGTKDRTLNSGKHYVIPGGIENKKKDLDGFLTFLQQHQDQLNNCTFHFLGKTAEDNPLLEKINALKDAGVKLRIHLETVDWDTFVRVLQTCDAILPLIHPGTPSGEDVWKTKISGSMNLSFGFQKPLLSHYEYRNIADIQDHAVFYQNDSELLALLGDDWSEKSSKIRDLLQYTPDYQEKIFIELLRNQIDNTTLLK